MKISFHIEIGLIDNSLLRFFLRQPISKIVVKLVTEHWSPMELHKPQLPSTKNTFFRCFKNIGNDFSLSLVWEEKQFNLATNRIALLFAIFEVQRNDPSYDACYNALEVRHFYYCFETPL